MSLNLLKTVLYVDVLILIGIFLFLYLTKNNLINKYKHTFYIAGCGIVPIFIVPNIFAMFAVIILFIVIVGRNRNKILVANIFIGFLSVPAIPNIIAGGTFLIALPIEIVISLGALLAMMLTKREAGSIRWSRDIPVILLLCLFWASDARGNSATNAMRVICYDVLLYAVPYFVIRFCLKTEDNLKLILSALACATMVVAVLCIFEAVRRWPTYFTFGQYHHIDTLMGTKLRGGALRSPGPLMNPLPTAELLAIGFFALVACRDFFKSRMKYYLGLGVVILGLVAPQSRGAWVGVVIGLLALAALRKGMKGIALQAGAVMAAGLMVLAMVPFNEHLGYMIGLRGDALRTADYRTRLFDSGMEEIRNHLLFGQSVDTVMVRLSGMRQGEQIIDFVNSYLYIALVSGLIGLMVFLAAFGIQSLTAWRNGRQGAAAGFPYAVFAFPAIVTAASMLVFTSIDKRVMWLTLIVFAISNATADILDRRRARAPLREEAPPPQGAAKDMAAPLLA